MSFPAGRCFALVLAMVVPAIGHTQTSKTPLVAVLMTYAYLDRLEALRSGLKTLGYEEGRSIRIVSRTASDERLDALARELIGLAPDVVVGDTAPTTSALARATTTVPIVFMATADPVNAGFVKSLAHPGGHITGLTEMTAELVGKRLQLLKEMRPGLKRVAVLANPDHAFHRSMMQETDDAARTIDLQLVHFEVRNRGEIERAFAAMHARKVEAVIQLPHPLFGNEQALIARLALAQRLPLSGGLVDRISSGALFAYGPDYTEQARRAAGYVDKILKGAWPGDLPVEQASKFELAVNLSTAKALGIKVQQSILVQATRVIE